MRSRRRRGIDIEYSNPMLALVVMPVGGDRFAIEVSGRVPPNEMPRLLHDLADYFQDALDTPDEGRGIHFLRVDP